MALYHVIPPRLSYRPAWLSEADVELGSVGCFANCYHGNGAKADLGQGCFVHNASLGYPPNLGRQKGKITVLILCDQENSQFHNIEANTGWVKWFKIMNKYNTIHIIIHNSWQNMYTNISGQYHRFVELQSKQCSVTLASYTINQLYNHWYLRLFVNLTLPTKGIAALLSFP